MSALNFTESEPLHWFFAKVRSYIPSKRLVKVLKFRISGLKWYLLATASDSH